MPGQLARQPLGVAEDEQRRVLLELDLALRREARAQQLRPHDLAELRLGQEQEVLRAAAPDAQRRDQPAFGVSSSASTTSPAVTSFESIRWR